MFTSLPCFSKPGARAAAAKGVPFLHSDIEGGFPTNLIFPNTELKEGNGVGPSIVKVPVTFEAMPPDMPVMHKLRRGGGGSCGGGGTGCRNCPKKVSYVHVSQFSSLLQSRRGTGWHANKMRYCSGGTPDLCP